MASARAYLAPTALAVIEEDGLIPVKISAEKRQHTSVLKSFIFAIINLKKLKNKLSICSGTIASTFILAHSKVLAASNTESIDGFITFACDWLTKIGGVVALVGGVMFALRMAT